MQILDSDEGPREVVSYSGALYPGGLGGKTFHAMEVTDSLFHAWKIIDVVDCCPSVRTATHLNVLGHVR